MHFMQFAQDDKENITKPHHRCVPFMNDPLTA
jgi:hypothetical protein